jgi:perosamine synthetase
MSETKKIHVAEPDLTGNEALYVVDAIQSEKLVSSFGKYISLFEQEIKKYCGREYALAVSNCTTGLHLALMALDIGPGDEVIVPAFTFAASAAVIAHVGATPVFIDSKLSDWNLDEKKLDSLLTKNTKAIITVDIYGVPANYSFIEKWCKKNKIFLIEDAAESLGGEHAGRKAGSFGDISCFSFFGNKNITTGEGGMCLTDNPELHERMRVLRNHGMQQAGLYDHVVVGYNYRMTNVQAAIGCAQFERFSEFLKKRKEHDKLYRKLLGKNKAITFQKTVKDTKSAFWMFSMLVNTDIPALREALREENIETRPLFKPLSLQPAYQRFIAHDLNKNTSFEHAERIYSHGISLPSSPLLTTKEIQKVCSVIKKFLTATNKKIKK